MGGGILLISIVIILFFKPHVDMRTHNYGEWWLFYIVAFAMIFTIVVFSKYLVGREYALLSWLGRNSLAIMCIHEPVKRILLVIVSKLGGCEVSVLRESVWISIGITILLVILLTPVILFINKYIPCVMGKIKNT